MVGPKCRGQDKHVRDQAYFILYIVLSVMQYVDAAMDADSHHQFWIRGVNRLRGVSLPALLAKLRYRSGKTKGDAQEVIFP